MQNTAKLNIDNPDASHTNIQAYKPKDMQKDNKSSQYILRAAHTGDDQALLNLISVPMTTRGVMLSFQRNPSYFNASQVVYTVNDHLVIEDRHTGELVACCSNGYRPCFINGRVKEMRYACDLRINTQYRGASLMQILGEHVGKMDKPDFNQIIIFNDNLAARKAVQTGKTGLPDYHEDDLIETLTLTGFKRDPRLAEYLQQLPDQYELSNINIITAQPSHVALMNGFIRKMADHYNFLPAYDFYELLYQSSYFQGLKIQDFQLYFDGDELVGMFGLWSQSSFKQSVILDYGLSIGVFRPLYNFWARLVGAMQLPRKGQAFKYHALHSLLCDPEQLSLHDRMLRDALALSKKRGVNAINYTLSHRDPRQQLNQFYKGELLTGMHGFLCNTRDPRPDFDIARIPYLEVGRI